MVSTIVSTKMLIVIAVMFTAMLALLALAYFVFVPHPAVSISASCLWHTNNKAAIEVVVGNIGNIPIFIKNITLLKALEHDTAVITSYTVDKNISGIELTPGEQEHILIFVNGHGFYDGFVIFVQVHYVDTRGYSYTSVAKVKF